jgi:hypothetical protein
LTLIQNIILHCYCNFQCIFCHDDDVNNFDCLILGFLENDSIKTEPDYTFYKDLRNTVLNLMKMCSAREDFFMSTETVITDTFFKLPT